jgi:hypothetical protein
MSNQSILDTFKVDKNLFSAIAENLTNLQSTSRTQSLRINKPVQFTGSINGIEVPAEVTLRSASLKRISILKHKSPNSAPGAEDKESLLVTGVMNPVKLDVSVIVNGTKMSLTDVLYEFLGESTSRDEFNSSMSSMGMNFDGEMPLFWQQFGASDAGIRHTLDAFKAAGAISVFDSIPETKRGRILGVYEHKEGVPMTSFELGTNNREMSRTGQGFINLVDAAFDTFQRVYKLRLEAHILSQKISDLPQAKVKEATAHKNELMKLSRQWASNWAGSQQRILVEKNSLTKTPQNMYDPVNAPCGRFTLVVNGSEIPCDLWSNSVRSEQNLTTNNSDADLKEDPF